MTGCIDFVFKGILMFLFLVPSLVFSQVNPLDHARTVYNLDSSITLVEQFLHEYEGAANDNERIEAGCYLASLYTQKSLYVKASRILDSLSLIPLNQNHQQNRALIQLERANLYLNQKDYASALEIYLSTIELLSNSNDDDLYLRAHVGVAEYYRKTVKLDKAWEYIVTALQIHNEKMVADSSLLIRVYNRAAAILNEQDSLASSLNYSRKALSLSRLTKDKYTEAITLNEIGFTLMNFGKIDSSLTLYREAEQLFWEIGAERDAVHVMNNKALAYARLGFGQEQVLKLYEEIVHLVKTKGIDYPLTEVYWNLYLENIVRGDTMAALQHLFDKHGAAMDEQIRRSNVEIANVVEKYENEKVLREKHQVETELQLSQQEVLERNAQNRRTTYWLIAVGCMVVLIGFLAIRLNKSRTSLRIKNSEKDALLKEIHHRVKNNLQIVHNLLEMETHRLDGDTREIILGGQNRVKAMAMIHKKLYQHEDITSIDFHAYLEELCAAIQVTWGRGDKNVNLSINTNGATFDLDTAIPLGLIVNELVTNCYKHASSPDKVLEIKIEIEDLTAGDFRLTVKDNGPGLSSHLDPNKLTSIGVKLVSRLAIQLVGDLRFYSDDGAIFVLTFKDTQARKQID